ncbi:calcium-activated chloride channel regulator 1-like [Amblyraja radiata]|uniref:calcium-activated chloride channel regulator 1-like n=1 Tax=Amblyraja radiata TaxID=386614 RepID=UPI001401D47D|nr:calcium-activated chloride channel regulator 1-like [Amblyraja radiata]
MAERWRPDRPLETTSDKIENEQMNQSGHQVDRVMKDLKQLKNKVSLDNIIKNGICVHLSLCTYIESCFGLSLVDNGYRNLVIAIKPSIKHNEMLLEKIQTMITDASLYLYRATKNKVYFSDVKILLPSSWPGNSSIQRPATESYEKASVIIAEENPKYGDTPYTLQYGGCGEKGQYIHFTPNFILNDSLLPIYGKKGPLFVHEWAHLQWGVFNEYNEEVPFYTAINGRIQATRCTKEITGSIKDCSSGSCSNCTINDRTGWYDKGCNFNPDKVQTGSSSIMYNQGLENVVEFCDETTHNTVAPNMQNQMCDYRSTWEVIKESEDFKNAHSTHNGSVQPTITLLQAKGRVLCLVLDISGSMSRENRINRVRQAAEIFLLQVVEPGSLVGIVTFNSGAKIKTHLKTVDNDNVRKDLVKLLPTSANRGTNICSGVRDGFKVLRGDDGSTNGDEIILLAGGEDEGISSCFKEVEESGTKIHTIALGPSAAKELEELSRRTDGLQFAVTDEVDSNGLIDAFTRLVSEDGDLSQQAIQLESLGRSIDKGGWFSGIVSIDKTIGNNTYFVVTWEDIKPDVILRSPRGKIYTQRHFKSEEATHTARLQIPGTAEAGNWFYNITNSGKTQKVTLTVTSRAVDENVAPVTVNPRVSWEDRKSPMVIYVEVSQGFLPVLKAKVIIIAELPSGATDEHKLFDNGLGADTRRNDGVYSRYFLNITGRERYSFKVRVEGIEGPSNLTSKRVGTVIYIRGLTIDGVVHPNPPRPTVSEENLVAQIGNFSRVKSGGAISNPVDIPVVNFPPSKITDLEARVLEDKIELEWTAPGADLDQGTASYYEMRMSNKLLLPHSFSGAERVNLTKLNPQPFGSKEMFIIAPESTELENRTTLYFAILAYDEKNQPSKMSNVAMITSVEPLPIIDNHRPRTILITAIVLLLVCLVVGLLIFWYKLKGEKMRRGCNRQQEDKHRMGQWVRQHLWGEGIGDVEGRDPSPDENQGESPNSFLQ